MTAIKRISFIGVCVSYAVPRSAIVLQGEEVLYDQGLSVHCINFHFHSKTKLFGYKETFDQFFIVYNGGASNCEPPKVICDLLQEKVP